MHFGFEENRLIEIRKEQDTMGFRDKIGKEILFFDGGMGTLLQERGLQTGEVPETWNILHPEIIRQINREYILAGSNVCKYLWSKQL